MKWKWKKQYLRKWNRIPTIIEKEFVMFSEAKIEFKIMKMWKLIWKKEHVILKVERRKEVQKNRKFVHNKTKCPKRKKHSVLIQRCHHQGGKTEMQLGQRKSPLFWFQHFILQTNSSPSFLIPRVCDFFRDDCFVI